MAAEAEAASTAAVLGAGRPGAEQGPEELHALDRGAGPLHGGAIITRRATPENPESTGE